MFRRITGRMASSLVVATFYGFGPFFVGQSGRLHLIACGPLLPLILLIGYRIFVTQRGSPVRVGVRLGVLAVALLLVAEEMAVMAALVSVIASAVAMYWQVQAQMPEQAADVTLCAVPRN